MAVPFRLEPESNDRPQGHDPLLEFDSERPAEPTAEQSFHRPSDRFSERPGRSGLFTPETLESLDLPTAMPASTAKLAIEPLRASALSPTLAFALGVAGLVAATVAFYQMGQLLAGRANAPVTRTGGAATGAPGAVAPGSASKTGRLEITSVPAGAPVSINGKVVGRTPLSLAAFAAGRHQVVIGRGPTAVTRSVDLAGGSTASVTAVIGDRARAQPTAARAPVAAAPVGWLSFDAPIDLRILAGGRSRGNTRGARVSFSEGTHDLELVNDTYEVRQFVSARVLSGRASRVSVPMPSGVVSLNALPWADVWIDGTPMGTTPLANLSVPVGPHVVVFRHPTLGERTQNVVVKARTPARYGVDLNR